MFVGTRLQLNDISSAQLGPGKKLRHVPERSVSVALARSSALSVLLRRNQTLSHLHADEVS